MRKYGYPSCLCRRQFKGSMCCSLCYCGSANIKKNLTIPRLKLIAAHMATNLLSNGKIDLSKYPIPNCYGWSDSITVLYSSCKIIMCTNSLLATEYKRSSNRASSSGITFRQQKILQTLGVEHANELISKTHYIASRKNG